MHAHDYEYKRGLILQNFHFEEIYCVLRVEGWKVLLRWKKEKKKLMNQASASQAITKSITDKTSSCFFGSDAIAGMIGNIDRQLSER